MHSTRREQRSLGEKDDFVLYMFEEDLEMIEKWAEEPSYTGKRPSGGYLLGLWTNTLNPVVHMVFKDAAAAGDYHFMKSPQFKNEKAVLMFSRIGYWSFEKRSREQCFQDTRFVFLEVEVKRYYSRSIAYHPVILFKGQNTRGKIEILPGKNPFRLREELSNLSSQEQNLKEEKNEGVVAFLRDTFESGVAKLTNTIRGTTQESAMQTSTVQQSYQDKQSGKVPSSSSDPSGMRTKDSSFPSQHEIKDVSTCTKGNQWYLAENGQKLLLEISDKLGEVINEKPKISRDDDTHNIMILFSFESKSYVIYFPPSFPRLNAELHRPMKTRNNRCFASTSKQLESKDPTSLVQEIINKLHNWP